MNWLTISTLVAVGSCIGFASDIPPPRPVDVAGLVRRLGSEDFAEREAASRRLATLNVDAVPQEVLAALESPNAEIRQRAAIVVKALREHIALAPERAAIARLPRGERFARRGQIDLFVASTAACEGKVNEDHPWVPAVNFGRKLIELADMNGDRKPHNCPSSFQDFATYKKLFNPLFTQTDEVYKSQSRVAPEVILSLGSEATCRFSSSLVVARGPVGMAISNHSLILATGDITCGDDINNSVVICDGDVLVAGHVQTSLIIARGKIKIGASANASNLIAGATVTIAKPREPGGAEFEKVAKIVIDEHALKPLGYVTFFELSAVGVEAKLADAAVTVTAVADGKPFAKAGVKVGDIITDVNSKKPESAESLRRLLRDALAVGDATITLRRGEKTETVKVALPE